MVPERAFDSCGEGRVRWLLTEGDESSGWRFLVTGLGLLALPWMALGGWVLVGTPWPAVDTETSSLLVLVYMLVSLLISIIGAGCLIASLVLLVSAETSRR